MRKIFLILGFLIFASNGFAQDSNPDGIIGQPVITVLLGLQDGGGKSSLSDNLTSISRMSDLDGSALWAEAKFPFSKTATLILNISWERQELTYFKTIDFNIEEKTKFAVYGIYIGLRFFGQ